MGAPEGRRSAQATSWGASRRETCRVWQAIAPPIGSSRVPSPAAALEGNPVVGRASPVQLPVGQPAGPETGGRDHRARRRSRSGRRCISWPARCAGAVASPVPGAPAPPRSGRREPWLPRAWARGPAAAASPARRRRRGRRCRRRGDRVVTSGGGSHPAPRDRAKTGLPVTASSRRTERMRPFPLIADHALITGTTRMIRTRRTGASCPRPFPHPTTIWPSPVFGRRADGTILPAHAH